MNSVEIRLHAAPPVQGEVVDESGNPVSDAKVFLGYCELSDGSFSILGEEGVTQTDASGQFELTEHPQALDVVSAYKNGRAAAWTTFGATSPLRIVLTEGCIVEGRVTRGGEAIGENTARVGVSFERGVSITSNETDGAGYYRVEQVPAGRMSISAVYNDATQRQWIRRSIDVIPKGANRVDIDFDANASAYIEGVLLLDGQPVPLALLQARQTLANGDTLEYVTESRGDGAFTVGPILPGTYTFGTHWILLRDGSYLTPEPETVTVQAEETLTQDLLFTSH